MWHALESAMGVTSLLSAGIIVAQATPMVPDDLKNWPVTAIAGLIALTSLGLLWFTIKSQYNNQSKAHDAYAEQAKESAKLSRALAVLTTHQDSHNRRMDELCAKISETNERTAELITTLENRPCIADDVMDHLKEANGTKPAKAEERKT